MKKILILIGFILPIQIFGQVWVARYNGSVSSPGAYDVAYAMAVDDSGYIYVTGESCDDYMTIKYNSSGDTVWVRKYNGQDNSDDQALAIAVDKSRNVYITGMSYGNGTYYDYATVKYNSTGDEVWVRRYDSGGGAGGIYDVGRALALDSIGNVYVTGTSNGNGGYTTIKYDSSGNTMWNRKYSGSNEVNAIAVDKGGNAYVTGTSVGSGNINDYAIIKYNSTGDTLWVRRYRKSGYIDNEANAIVVDNSGNVYVTGVSSKSFSSDTISEYATIKYNSSGDTVWVRTYSGTSKKNYDDVKVSSTYKEIIAIAPNRVKTNKNLFGQRGATALAIDSDGNVYVTGRSYASATNYDYATIKYNSSGDTMWVRRYNGTGDSIDVARGIVLDNDGNVYVTGNSWGVGSAYGEDYATIKYNSSGSEEWVQRYNGPANMVDNAYSIAVDNKGYVYVTGGSEDYNYDYTTIKYSTVGIEEPLTLDFGLGIWELKAFPNPFIGNTVISYSGISYLGNKSTNNSSSAKGTADKQAKIQIYDIAGKLVKSLPMTQLPNDQMTSITWDGKDNNGRITKSGIYFVKLVTDNYRETKKLLLIK